MQYQTHIGTVLYCNSIRYDFSQDEKVAFLNGWVAQK